MKLINFEILPERIAENAACYRRWGGESNYGKRKSRIVGIRITKLAHSLKLHIYKSSCGFTSSIYIFVDQNTTTKLAVDVDPLNFDVSIQMTHFGFYFESLIIIFSR